MTEAPRRPKIATRLAVLMSGLTAATALAGILAVWMITNRLEGAEIGYALDRSHEVADGAMRRRLGNLELVAGMLGRDPPFRAYVAEGDAASILDNLQERLALAGCDAFVVTDRTGALLADTRRPGMTGVDLSASEAVAPALRGESVAGLWLDPDGRLYLVAVSPIVQGGTDLAGAIAALTAIDDAFATELRGAAGADVVFYAGGREAPSAASIDAPRAERERIDATASSHIEIGGEDFAVRSYPITGLGAKPLGTLAVLRSIDREVSALNTVQAALLWVGGIAVLLAVATGTVLARRITRPVAALVRATERIAAGDLEAPVPAAEDDEIGALADAFRAMVKELKEKSDMESYLASVVREVAAPADRSGEATLTEGARVLAGRFELGPLLGSGGMGAVYSAFDRVVGERVALKVLHDGPAVSEPILQEVRLARRITHRNVVRTHDVVAIDGGWALSMEYVEGLSLAELLRRGPLPFAAALGIAHQVAAGLEAAHAQGIVHRDLKPANVLLDSRGVAKIADFGLAQLGPAARGSFAGTPQYMAPEQAEGRAADARSDVYAAGVMFFELFCGVLPFDAKQRRDPPPRPSSLRPDLPLDVEAVIVRALERNPALRFPSGRELGAALREKKRAGVATGPFHERPELS